VRRRFASIRGKPALIACAAACVLTTGVGRPDGVPPRDTTPTSRALKPGPRVILLSIDAGADWLVDQYIAAGKAPAFAALARGGAVADSMTSVLPSLTAPAHATLWTGAWPQGHGVVGNSVPRPPSAGTTLLSQRSGFLSDVLLADPIWRTAARAGKRVFVAQATGGFPFLQSHQSHPDRLVQFDVYGSELARAEVRGGRLVEGHYDFAMAGIPASLTPSRDAGLTLEVQGQRVPLVAGQAGRYTAPFLLRVGERLGSVRLRLLAYDSVSGEFLLLCGRISEIASTHPARLPAFRQAAGTIVGEAVTSFYRSGRFGRTIGDGGDGQAEDRLAEALGANQDYFDGALTYAAREPWDLLVLYNPNLDAALHALSGMLDPPSARYTAEVAAKVWPALDRIFARTVDGYVAAIRRLFPHATLVISSDHGMEGTGRAIFPNVILRKAGLLALDANGAIDLSRTKAVALPGHAGGLHLNSTAWKGGIVTDAERAQVATAVITAMLGARDPETGTPLVRAIYDKEVDGDALGFAHPLAADFHLDPMPGYEIAPSWGNSDVIVASNGPTGNGEHGPAPWRRRLHGIFYAAGPRVRPGTRLPPVRAIDVAPTVARLLGIPPPTQSTGVALDIVR
jgi:predicted AlkP superfamily pyrophosphatase or phosphodiesterase